MRIAIAGAGNAGRAIARELISNGHHVLLIDKNPKALKMESSSLLAKTEYGVPRVVARVNHPKNEWLFDSSWGVDVAVSTPRIIAALVEEAVSVGDVVRLFSLKAGEANLVELTLPDDSICIGKSVAEVQLPDDASLAAIIRDGHVISPSAHDVFSAGDELIFVASARAEELLKGCFVSN